MLLHTIIASSVAALAVSGGCPAIAAIQSANVAGFDMATFATGERMYEIAYKDALQPRFCSCMTSRKFASGDDYVYKVTMNCKEYPVHTKLAFRNIALGQWVGKWVNTSFPIVENINFPSALIDYQLGADSDGKERVDWLLEFGCSETLPGYVGFYHIVMHSIENSHFHLQAMLDAAERAGLGRFLTSGNAIQIVDHSDCNYEIEDH